jgi:type IV secretory pathway TrbD component
VIHITLLAANIYLVGAERGLVILDGAQLVRELLHALRDVIVACAGQERPFC